MKKMIKNLNYIFLIYLRNILFYFRFIKRKHLYNEKKNF